MFRTSIVHFIRLVEELLSQFIFRKTSIVYIRKYCVLKSNTFYSAVVILVNDIGQTLYYTVKWYLNGIVRDDEYVELRYSFQAHRA